MKAAQKALSSSSVSPSRALPASAESAAWESQGAAVSERKEAERRSQASYKPKAPSQDSKPPTPTFTRGKLGHLPFHQHPHAVQNEVGAQAPHAFCCWPRCACSPRWRRCRRRRRRLCGQGRQLRGQLRQSSIVQLGQQAALAEGADGLGAEARTELGGVGGERLVQVLQGGCRAGGKQR